ncbi:hypothetical protein [Ligilactobacillus murinus]|uniref:Uncharacterized protein n=1 Tax=Ligilactobacillus murinus TaxID=1622 RepID=A0AAD0L0W8_9LACO|nr:hypothetical protein [Ligilactobacillus murinus]AWZ39026.1 hypothetical protein CPS94_08880 [Ligilactobacillus murinus]AWZ39996.1 hypothetical protein CPQ89_02545 [Ligilactobacillus murinus]MCR1881609.1 hypothetical protein [Ligilactobacillus murinus]MCR1891819.1 hypothetical protein [Ligilactobacillus murinus]
MDYPKTASLWTSYKNSDLRAFFKSNFFRTYVKEVVEKHGIAEDDNLPYIIRLQLADDMQKLGLIPFTALEDAYSEERELEELNRFAQLYKF